MDTSVKDQKGTDNRSRRHWKNYLTKPGYNMPYNRYFVFSGLAMFAATAGLIHLKLEQVTAITNMAPVLTMAQQAKVQALLSDVTLIAIGGFVLYAITSFVIAFVMTHRITGPMVALVDIMRQFGKGDFGYRRPLRRGDQLGQLHAELMGLGAALREREEGSEASEGEAEAVPFPRPRAAS